VLEQPAVTGAGGRLGKLRRQDRSVADRIGLKGFPGCIDGAIENPRGGGGNS